MKYDVIPNPAGKDHPSGCEYLVRDVTGNPVALCWSETKAKKLAELLNAGPDALLSNDQRDLKRHFLEIKFQNGGLGKRCIRERGKELPGGYDSFEEAFAAALKVARERDTSPPGWNSLDDPFLSCPAPPNAHRG